MKRAETLGKVQGHSFSNQSVNENNTGDKDIGLRVMVGFF